MMHELLRKLGFTDKDEVRLIMADHLIRKRTKFVIVPCQNTINHYLGGICYPLAPGERGTGHRITINQSRLYNGGNMNYDC